MYEIVGKKNINYKRKTDGKQIQGVEYYLCGDSTDDRVEGRETLTAYVSAQNQPGEGLPIGAIVRPCYNRYGRIDALMRIDL